MPRGAYWCQAGPQPGAYPPVTAGSRSWFQTSTSYWPIRATCRGGPNWVTAAWAPAALVWSSTRNVAVAGGWYHDFLAAQA